MHDRHKLAMNCIYGKALYPEVWDNIKWSQVDLFIFEPSTLFDGNVSVKLKSSGQYVLMDMAINVLEMSGFPKEFCAAAEGASKRPKLRRRPKLKRRQL